MQDTIIKNTGNSRSLRSAAPSTTTWEQALEMLRNGTFPIDIMALNSNGVEQLGTPLSKENILPDDLAATMGVTSEGTLALFLRQVVSKSFIVKSLNVSDFNAATEHGLHWVSSISNTGHAPDGLIGSGWVMVFAITGTNYIGQLLIVPGSGIWLRAAYAGLWDFPWVHMVLSDNLATSSANGLMTAADKAAFDTSVMQGRSPGSIASLDDLKTGGAYWVFTTSQTPGQIAGWPTNETDVPRYGFLSVFTNNTTVYQNLLMYNNTGMYRTYTRLYTNGRWYPWNSITADSGDQELTSSMRNTTNISTISGFYRKVGNQVTCHFDLTAQANIGANTQAEAFTLPTGYRPSGTNVWYGQGLFDGKPVGIEIGSAGKVSIKPSAAWSSSTGHITGFVNFFV